MHYVIFSLLALSMGCMLQEIHYGDMACMTNDSLLADKQIIALCKNVTEETMCV